MPKLRKVATILPLESGLRILYSAKKFSRCKHLMILNELVFKYCLKHGVYFPKGKEATDAVAIFQLLRIVFVR